MLHQTGGFRGQQFAGVIGIYIRPTPVSMATKNVKYLTQN